MSKRHFFPALSAAFLGSASLAAAAKLKAPNEPSNLRVKALGNNSFQLKWKDNSKNESGWEILVARKGNPPVRYALVPTPDLTSYTIITSEVPGVELDFQMASYISVDGKVKFSKPTSIVTAKALDTSSFGKPAKLKAKAIDDGRIRITWKDKATTEHGYQMQYKASSSKTWLELGTSQPGTRFKVPASGFDAATRYSFRVRAFKGNPAEYTPFAKVAKVKTKPFRAPAGLVATPEGEGSFTFKWKDRSSLELGYELEAKTGTGDFTSQGTVPANTTSVDPVAFTLDTSYQFRVRGYRTVGTEKVYSGYSNVVSAKSTTLTKPSNVVAKATSDTSATVTWKDESTRDNGFEIKYRQVGTTPFTTAGVAGNVASFTAAKLKPGVLYEFQVRSVSNGFFGNRLASSAAVSVQTRTKDGIAGNFAPPIFLGSSFSYPIEISRLGALSSLTVTGLPAGLVYNAGPKTITGTATVEGAKTVVLTAKFNDGSTVARNLVLRIIRPETAPVITAAFAPVEVASGNNSVVPLAGKFADPDTPSAARVSTSLGSFDIILYSLATPLTVDNFLDYVDAGRYDNSFFHRSVDSDNLTVIQGGGYQYTSESGFTKVTKYPTVKNEPGISNVTGTVAMAKLGGNPDSADSEFFVNISDENAPNLDEQNEGFTVFGRVPDSGMAVVEDINELPTRAYSVSPFGSGAFGNVPMNAATAPIAMEPDKLVKINSVTAAPILGYQAVSQDEAVATASVTGTNVTITAVGSGSTTIEVTATDLDGSSVSQTIEVTVP